MPIKKPDRDFRDTEADLKRVVKMFDQVGFTQFVRHLSSPRRLFWSNFLAGMAKGLGIVVGMTIVVALAIWVLAKLVDFPLIGEYFLELKELLEAMSPAFSS